MSLTIYPANKCIQVPVGTTNLIAFPCSVLRYEQNGGEVRAKSQTGVDHNTPTEETVVSAEYAPTKYQYLIRLHCRQSGKFVVDAGQNDVYYNVKLAVARGYIGSHKEGHLEFVKMPTDTENGIARSVITKQSKEFPMPRNLGPIENLLYASLQAIYVNPPAWCKPKLNKMPQELADTMKRLKDAGWPERPSSRVNYMSLANQVAQHLLGIYCRKYMTIEKLTECGLLNGSIPLVGPYPSVRIYDTLRDVSFLGVFVEGDRKHHTKNLQLLNVIKQKLGLTPSMDEFKDALREAQRAALDNVYVSIHKNQGIGDNISIYPIGVITTKQL